MKGMWRTVATVGTMVGSFQLFPIIVGATPCVALAEEQGTPTGTAGGSPEPKHGTAPTFNRDRWRKPGTNWQPVAQGENRPRVDWRQSLPHNVQMFKDLSYVEKQVSKSQSLDLYVPALKDGAKAPLVIWIHGGGWRGGDKDGGPFQALIREGFAVASINYRLSWEAIYPAQYEDCVSALRWLVAHADKYNIDNTRIGMWGASAGGHLSALVGLRAGNTSDVKDLKIKAVCDWFGPVDLPLIIKDKREAGQSAEIVGQLIGGPDNLKLAAEASPVTYVHKGGPPFLIMHGSADNLVPMKQSEVLQQKLKDAGVKTQLEVIEGGHGFPGFGWETIKKVVDFFKENLG